MGMGRRVGACAMVWGSSRTRQGFRCCLLGLAPVAAAIAITANVASAEKYSPPTASIVVDGNSGTALQASNPDAPRHPASLTKIMTLYLLFERLETGKLKLDSQLKVSEHASEQAPTKLGLRPGETIAVEDAIKAIVTKSANDAAVAVAENLAGDEDYFAKLMTQKAGALGMTRTTYTNASGLPDDDQITTARDQALLGRLIQKRFPRYYKYFSTESFVYHGATMRNHNHLLGAIEGVDGIKTGFTQASGFNLVTSVHRDGRYIVAVVMGGRSSLERDAQMRELISAQIKGITLKRAVPVVAKSNQPSETKPALAYVPMTSQGNPLDPIQPLSSSTFQTTPVQSASLAPTPQPNDQVATRWLPPAPPDNAAMTAPASAVIEENTLPSPHGDPTVPNQPLSVKTATFQPVPSASLAPMPVLVPVAANAPQPSAQVAARWLPPALPDDASMTASATTVIGKSTLPLSRIDPTISNRPRSVKTITIHTAPVQPASVAPTPVLVPDAAAAARPSTQVAARWLPSAPPTDSSRTVVASPEPMPIVQSPAQAAPAFSEPAKLESKMIEAAKLAGARVELAKIETVNAAVNSHIAASSPKAPHAHDGWLIQIGAFDREDEAKQHLSMARLKIRDALATAHPLTERVQQGDKVLYRARFTGFNKETAEAACQRFKRSDTGCIALKDPK
jgi:D-alanyl-D-alanine carboxypeptidase